MTQLEPSLPLQLKHLAGSGAVLAAEAVVSLQTCPAAQNFLLFACSAWFVGCSSCPTRADATPYISCGRTVCGDTPFWRQTRPAQAALDHSLPIKRREAGLCTLVLWGRLLTRSGKVCSSAGTPTPGSGKSPPTPLVASRRRPLFSACTAVTASVRTT